MDKLTEFNKVWTAFTRKGHDIMDTNRSELIKNGLKKSFQSGASAKASTSCYGYKTTTEGNLVVYPIEAIYVIHIFDRFVAGDSLGKIASSLARMGVLSPTGKAKWSRETISKILENEKYTGDVILGKTEACNGVQMKKKDQDFTMVIKNHHPAIISSDLFHAAKEEKIRRSKKRIIVKNNNYC